jgi:hypothetical protein
MAIGRITGQMLSANLARSGTDLTFETNLLALDVTNSRIGIGTASPATTLHVNATDALRLPSGNDAQRPGSPANGDIRYNSEQTTIEGYTNGAWANLASGTQLKDADEDTSVNVEPSTDLDEVHVTIAGTKRAKFAADTVELGVTGVSTTASTITSLTTNGDITLTPNGTGSVIVTNGTTLQTDTADINGGAIDAVTIGSNSAATALVANGGINIDDDGDGAMDGVVIGANTAAAGTFTDLTANGTINIDSTGTGNIDNVVIGANTAAAGTFTTVTTTGNATIGGDLTVNGTTTTIDSQTLVIEDPLLTLAKNNSGGAGNTFDQGLFFNRGSDDNVSFLWDESEDQFAFAVTSGEDGTTAGAVTIDSYAALKAGVTTVSDLETGVISAADGTESATIANSTGVMTIASSVLTTTDINGGSIDGAIIGAATPAAATVTDFTANGTINIDSTGNMDGIIIGASSAAAGTFTTATATNVQTSTVKANDGTAAITIADSTGAVAVSTNVSIDGGTFVFNETGADTDFRFEGDNNANLLYGDAGNDRIGIKTATPGYTLDIGSATDGLLLPKGTEAQRPTAATGIIRFNSDSGAYEGSTDGSTWVNFAIAGAAPTFTKETTTGDGSTTTFSGFFSSAPESANNVFVYIDNVYQEPTENYSVSGTNITFTSAPHSGARIFAITGADGTSLVTGGVARSESTAVNFTSSATNIFTFNGATYRSAELFIQMQDTANTEYSAMKAIVTHDGTTAYISVFGITNTGASDLGTVTANYNSGTVEVKATSTGGQTEAKVQYSLAAI